MAIGSTEITHVEMKLNDAWEETRDLCSKGIF